MQKQCNLCDTHTGTLCAIKMRKKWLITRCTELNFSRLIKAGIRMIKNQKTQTDELFTRFCIMKSNLWNKWYCNFDGFCCLSSIRSVHIAYNTHPYTRIFTELFFFKKNIIERKGNNTNAIGAKKIQSKQKPENEIDRLASTSCVQCHFYNGLELDTIKKRNAIMCAIGKRRCV